MSGFDFQSIWATVSPKRKRLAIIAGVSILTLAVIAVFQHEPPKRERPYDKKSDQVRNVLTDRSARNASIDAISGKLKVLNKDNEELGKQVKRLESHQRDKADIRALEERFEQKLAALSKQIAQLQTQQGGTGSSKGETLEPNPFNGVPPAGEQLKDKTQKKNTPMIRVFTEETESDKDKAGKEKKAAVGDAQAYIPAGSIVTGTILSGGDFPTNKAGFDNPTPLLIRISKEAILPNRFKTDIRECFLLTGGRGDLASERVKLRGEMLSCVRDDGSVIEAKLNSYVTGEDGKEGVKGRLVSKQGQIIARSLVSGFASGLADVFDVNAVPTVTTSSDGKVEYQSVYSSNAMQGAAVKGFSNAMERISDFYLDMAKDIFPVVEINAGRQVDVVVISGTRLKVSAERVNPNNGEE